MLLPATVLAGLTALIGISAWVAAVLHEPARFPGSPALIQKLSRIVYWHTRRHWQTVPECVEFSAEFLYRPRPGSCMFENAEFRTVMHFDQHGARMTPDPASQPGSSSARPRIVVVGDSHAMGWGVEDHETFTGFLASEFGYATVNLGVSSYSTPRELARIRRDAVLQPDDIIVIQYCDNDLKENQAFAETGRNRPYKSSELESLIAYRPTPAKALPIAGLLLRMVWQDLANAVLSRHRSATEAALSPSSAFLAVLKSDGAIRDHRVIVVAINGAGLGTHLSAAALTSAGYPLISPKFSTADFFDLDDHMRPRGHRAVAAALDEAIRSLAADR